MDLNESIEFDHPSSSTPPPQMHNFVPISSLLLPYNSSTKEISEEVKRCRLIEALNHHLKMFWNQQMLEIYNSSGFKNNHQLPLARIKRIMKSDGAVKMISADAPVLFSKACELFIMELSLRAWLHTEESKRRTLQSCDIVKAIRFDNIFGFLRDSPLCHRHHHHCRDDENLSHMEEIAVASDIHTPVRSMDEMNGVMDSQRFSLI